MSGKCNYKFEAKCQRLIFKLNINNNLKKKKVKSFCKVSCWLGTKDDLADWKDVWWCRNYRSELGLIFWTAPLQKNTHNWLRRLCRESVCCGNHEKTLIINQKRYGKSKFLEKIYSCALFLQERKKAHNHSTEKKEMKFLSIFPTDNQI